MCGLNLLVVLKAQRLRGHLAGTPGSVSMLGRTLSFNVPQGAALCPDMETTEDCSVLQASTVGPRRLALCTKPC